MSASETRVRGSFSSCTSRCWEKFVSLHLKAFVSAGVLFFADCCSFSVRVHDELLLQTAAVLAMLCELCVREPSVIEEWKVRDPSARFVRRFLCTTNRRFSRFYAKLK